MAAVFKLIFLKKINEFWLKFPRSFSQVYNSQQFSIGSDNGLAPTRWKGIIWTNDAYFTDAYMRRTASMSQHWPQPVLIFSFRSYCTNCFYTWRPRQNVCHSKNVIFRTSFMQTVVFQSNFRGYLPASVHFIIRRCFIRQWISNDHRYSIIINKKMRYTCCLFHQCQDIFSNRPIFHQLKFRSVRAFFGKVYAFEFIRISYWHPKISRCPTSTNLYWLTRIFI